MVDLDSLLDSMNQDGSFPEETGASSEAQSADGKDPKASTASVEVVESKSTEPTAHDTEEKKIGDGEGVGSKEDDSAGVAKRESEGNGDGVQSATEAEGMQPRNDGQDNAPRYNKNKRKKGFSRLQSAEYKAEKWKTKAKEAIAARNELMEEFMKYKDLNPRAFENDEDRMEFLAWKASTAQRLNDMDSDIDAMAEEGEREAFAAKVADCYNEEGAAQFEKLDDHYRKAFSFACKRFDPDNVIVDFLSGSKFEAPMREVIYKNGKLQKELFRNFRNPAIAASERLAVLKSLELQVRDFLAGTGSNMAPSANPEHSPAAPRHATETHNQHQNQGQPQQTRPRFVLPSMNAAPSASVRSSNSIARKASGSLTRGSEPSANLDVSSQADALFKELLKNGI